MPYSDEAHKRATREILPALRETQAAVEQTIARGGWLPHLAMKNAYA